MRKAKYSLKKVICKNSSCIGYSSNIAKPGYWVTYKEGLHMITARVLGRIDESEANGVNCAGFLAVMRLHTGLRSAGIAWVNPDDVRDVYQKPPAELLAWITGDAWVKNAGDIARLIAMQAHGTTSEDYIASRDDADKAYNARPAYVNQFILK